LYNYWLEPMKKIMHHPKIIFICGAKIYYVTTMPYGNRCLTYNYIKTT
jgi:hypothetical protein